MGRKPKSKTYEDIERLIKEGRGQGEREKYLAWIRVQELSSRGSSKRYPGKKIKRLYHLFSLLGVYLTSGDPSTSSLRKC